MPRWHLQEDGVVCVVYDENSSISLGVIFCRCVLMLRVDW